MITFSIKDTKSTIRTSSTIDPAFMLQYNQMIITHKKGNLIISAKSETGPDFTKFVEQVDSFFNYCEDHGANINRQDFDRMFGQFLSPRPIDVSMSNPAIRNITTTQEEIPSFVSESSPIPVAGTPTVKIVYMDLAWALISEDIFDRLEGMASFMFIKNGDTYDVFNTMPFGDAYGFDSDEEWRNSITYNGETLDKLESVKSLLSYIESQPNTISEYEKLKQVCEEQSHLHETIQKVINENKCNSPRPDPQKMYGGVELPKETIHAIEYILHKSTRDVLNTLSPRSKNITVESVDELGLFSEILNVFAEEAQGKHKSVTGEVWKRIKGRTGCKSPADFSMKVSEALCALYGKK